jgi:hypothetical protein
VSSHTLSLAPEVCFSPDLEFFRILFSRAVKD